MYSTDIEETQWQVIKKILSLKKEIVLFLLAME